MLEQLKDQGWNLGGESSGHIICLDRTTTGDGVVSALQVVEAMVKSGRSLHDLKQGMRKCPQRMINVPVRSGFRPDSEGVSAAVRDAESELGDKGRVLLRPSGTEPVVRVMVEGEDAAQVTRLATVLAERVAAAAGD